MKQLKVFEWNGRLVADSREVAEMVGKRHSDLLESIDGYIKHLLNGNFRSADFFIESTYQDSTGRTLKCYLLTRKGCDMVANKMTGEKGVLFTAAYVTKFEEMEKQLQQSVQLKLTPEQQLRKQLELSILTSERVDRVEDKVNELAVKIEKQITLTSYEQRALQKAIAKRVYELVLNIDHNHLKKYIGEDQWTEWDKKARRKMFSEVHRAIKDSFVVASYRDIRRCDFEEAIKFVQSWRPKLVA